MIVQEVFFFFLWVAYGNINSEHGGIGVENLSASGANFLNFC